MISLDNYQNRTLWQTAKGHKIRSHNTSGIILQPNRKFLCWPCQKIVYMICYYWQGFADLALINGTRSSATTMLNCFDEALEYNCISYHISMEQLLKIPPRGKQEPVDPTKSMPLLFMAWWCEEPGISSHDITDDSRFAPSQWETLLQSNDVSHWLGANLESALRYWPRSHAIFHPRHQKHHGTYSHVLAVLPWTGQHLGTFQYIKMSSYQYRNPHVKDKTVSQPSHL